MCCCSKLKVYGLEDARDALKLTAKQRAEAAAPLPPNLEFFTLEKSPTLPLLTCTIKRTTVLSGENLSAAGDANSEVSSPGVYRGTDGYYKPLSWSKSTSRLFGHDQGGALEEGEEEVPRVKLPPWPHFMLL